MDDIFDEKSLNVGKAIAASVDPKIAYGITYASAAKHYFGTSIATVIGGLIGYAIGHNSESTIEDKQRLVQEIMQSRNRASRNSQFDDNDMEQSVGGIMSAEELMGYQYDKYEFDGKWGDFVGNPSVNFHAMIFGRPKQGKSILAIQWAKYLSENFGRVLYVASEEGFSVTLQKKVIEFAMNNTNLDFGNFRDFQQIKNVVNNGNYQFVFIDSVNYIKILPNDVEEIKAENKNTAFITIQQATKNGAFRGSQEFAHNCDMIIKVEAGVAGHEGRFAENTIMNVFDAPEGSENKKDGSFLEPPSETHEFSAGDFNIESKF